MTNVHTAPNLKEGTTYHMGKNDKDGTETNNDNDNLSVKEHSSVSLRNWKFFGYNVPKPEIIFFSQVVIIYIVVITALINVAISNGDTTVWISLLCSCLGYMLPSPSLPSAHFNNRRFS
jgi:hypothetical protein